nr:hypothetical protein [Tanacetum cinerariifolium]
MHVANTTTETRCLALEAKLANLRETNNQDNHTELISHFSKLEGSHLNLQLKYQNLKDQIGNSPPTPDKDTPDFDSVFVIGKMQASLQGKNNTTDSQITKLTDQVTHLQAQNDLFRAENDKIKQHYKELYDSIKITHAKHIEQVTKVTTENMNLKTSVSKATVNPLVSARDKHAIDVEPVVPRLRNNRNAHIDYLRHLKEIVETICDIVEEAKVVRPLDRSIVSVCRYTKHSQELLEYVIGICPHGSQPCAKQLAYIPLIRKKQVIVAQPSNKLDSTTHPHVVTVTSQKINVPVPPSTGVDCCPIANGSQLVSHVKPNRISPAKGDTKLPIDNKPRKNKSHLRTSTRIDSSSRLKRTVTNSHSDSVCQTCVKCLTPSNHDLCVATCLQSAMATPSIHYNCSVEQKRPTGRIFDLGNQCPLTKFTPPKVVSATQHTKRASPCANQKEPNQNWGSKLSNSLSLSGFKCRSYRSSFDKMADVNAPSDQTPTMAPPVRADDQILPHIQWIPIGKSNCYLDLEKSQSNPIYKIAMDLLKNTTSLGPLQLPPTYP